MATSSPALIRLARPHQWTKGAFVLIGPVYAMFANAAGVGAARPSAGTPIRFSWPVAVAVLGAFLAFGFASSVCYVVNDIVDVEEDRAHPRKKRRPIASGEVSVPTARAFALGLLALAAASVGLTLVADPSSPGRSSWAAAGWLGVAVGLYLANTLLYSAWFKHAVVLDVISLSAGFVLRVLGGCAAAGVTPSSWLLNVTFFISMFLAFGKRLGERRTMKGDAAAVRAVHHAYTDELLRMAVVVTGVACLVTYAGYVEERGDSYQMGFNILWLTMLPATYGLLRCIVLLERGEYDDPTDLATKDRPFQFAAALFVLTTLLVMVVVRK